MPKIYFEKLNKSICEISKKPAPANTSPPSWWRSMESYLFSENEMSLPLNHRNFGTVKACPAIQDSFNFGYNIYSPVDIYLDTTEKDEVRWHAGLVTLPEFKDDLIDSLIETMPYENTEGYPRPVGYHKAILKFSPLWGIKTEKGYSTWFTSPQHRPEIPIKILDGLVDTDKMPARSPFAFFLKENFSGVIKAGTPIIQAIPFKRDDWTSEYIEADIEDYRRHKLAANTIFTNPYKKLFWSRKRFK